MNSKFNGLQKEINISLIAKCLAKDVQAQRVLYDIMLPYIEMICRRYLKNESNLKDVLQDTFIKIFKHLDQFDIQKTSFKTWSSQIAINNCLKNNNKYKRDATEELIVNFHEPMVMPKAIDKMTNEELLAWLKKMPSSYFQVFNMYVVDGMSHREIAKKLDIDISLSRQRLSRARNWLKKRLSDERESSRISPLGKIRMTKL